MAAFENTRVNHASAGQFGQFFFNLLANISHWNAARKTRAQLSKLTDQELDDIGLVRADLDAI